MRRKAILGSLIGVAVLAVTALIYLLLIAPDAWDSGVDSASTGVDDAGNPWIGAKNPKLVIHEFIDYDCPHCPKVHRALRSLLASRLDTIRLVRHDYARMACTPNDAVKRYSRCEMVRAAICASEDVSFWKWNDRVIASPRVDGPRKEYRTFVDRTRESFEIPKESFEQCLYDPATIMRAQSVYQEAKRLKVPGTPTYIVNGRIVPVPELFEMIKKI